jgi:hypothetical protein
LQAALKTPEIFNVHALRAEIYLERGNETIAHEEIRKMSEMVYRNASFDRLTNLRPLLEWEASYHAATGDYEKAKERYRNKGVFTDAEATAAIRRLEIEQAYRRH